jgi:hypothetical protein
MLIVVKLREATEARYNNAAAVRVTGAMLTTAACLFLGQRDLQKVPTPLTQL